MNPSKKVRQITVVVGLVIKDGKILLVRRDEPELPQVHLKWEFPGGKVDFRETPGQAIVRELKEETGVTVTVKRLLPHVETVFWEYPSSIQQTLLFAFECEYISKEKRKPDHHIKAVRWVTLGKFEKYETLPGGSNFLKALLNA